MNTCFLRDAFLPTLWSSVDNICAKPSAVLETVDVIARNDLAQSSSFQVSNFNKLSIEEKDVWWMQSNVLSSTFPFNGTHRTAQFTMFVNIESEF